MRQALTSVTIAAMVLMLAAIATSTIRGQADAAKDGLPGARPIIDAAKYPSIQAALDAVPVEGGVVQLPPGVFEINQPLRIRTEDTLLVGSGTATHIKNINAAGEPALIIEHPDNAPGKAKYLWRIHLSSFRITGNEKSGHGIVARRINEIFIEGVTVSYHGGDGILLDHCYEDPRIASNLITYNKGTGLNLLGCHDIVVASNQFEENVDAVRCFDGFNLCMTGNCLDDHLGHGVVIENTYGSAVSGNMIEECRGAAVILDRDCYGNTISANVIAHDAGGGVLLRDAHGCAVSANTFTIMGADAVYIGPKSGRITVCANNFSNSYIGDGKVKRGSNDLKAHGLALESTRDVAVSGNVFASVQPRALELRGEASTRVVFGHNVLTDVQSDHEKLEASVVEGNVTAE